VGEKNRGYLNEDYLGKCCRLAEFIATGKIHSEGSRSQSGLLLQPRELLFSWKLFWKYAASLTKADKTISSIAGDGL
jgi:hypothetical protein